MYRTPNTEPASFEPILLSSMCVQLVDTEAHPTAAGTRRFDQRLHWYMVVAYTVCLTATSQETKDLQYNMAWAQGSSLELE